LQEQSAWDVHFAAKLGDDGADIGLAGRWRVQNAIDIAVPQCRKVNRVDSGMALRSSSGS